MTDEHESEGEVRNLLGPFPAVEKDLRKGKFLGPLKGTWEHDHTCAEALGSGLGFSF